ncbi:hypothetical protein [Sorangium sp. So ce1182]|uniref:hypothetical protein n=1 Tax=Sorangium sp. So ce1182 TaxID=3133334 RepID=UPI003F63392F
MRGMLKGFAAGSARYGFLMGHFKPAVVNGFMYSLPVVPGTPEGGSGPPPKLVLWLLLRLPPGMRARIRQSCHRGSYLARIAAAMPDCKVLYVAMPCRSTPSCTSS